MHPEHHKPTWYIHSLWIKCSGWIAAIPSLVHKNPHTIPEHEHQRINELYESNYSKSASNFDDHEASVLRSDQDKIQNLKDVIAKLTKKIGFFRKLAKLNSFL